MISLFRKILSHLIILAVFGLIILCIASLFLPDCNAYAEKDYIVTFLDADGNTLSAEHYNLGEAVTIPESPSKASTATTNYSFACWEEVNTHIAHISLEGYKCAGNITFQPTYNESDRTYDLVFKNYDDTVFWEGSFKYNESINVPTPQKESDNVYSYTFKEWSPTFDGIVKESGEYIATFTPVPRVYTITFYGENNVKLKTSPYYYGDTIQQPTDPVKEPDEMYAYTFTGWGKEFSTTCVGDATYFAQFQSDYRLYNISFKGKNGNTISTANYHYGDKVNIPDVQGILSEEITLYFGGWYDQEDNTKTILSHNDMYYCYEDKVYIASFNTQSTTFQITFYTDETKTQIIKTKNYNYGDKIDFPTFDERKKGKDNYNEYEFSNWNIDIPAACCGSGEYYPVYTAIPRQYVVVFLNANEEIILMPAYYEYGEEFDVATPTQVSDYKYDYAFAGWGDTYTGSCVGDAIYTATYTQSLREYTITFLTEDGSTISSRKYKYGESVTTPPAVTKKADALHEYVFEGWGNDYSIICVANATYTPHFSLVPRIKRALTTEQKYIVLALSLINMLLLITVAVLVIAYVVMPTFLQRCLQEAQKAEQEALASGYTVKSTQAAAMKIMDLVKKMKAESNPNQINVNNKQEDTEGKDSSKGGN